MIFLKDAGVEPLPNHTRDIKKGIARWDGYVYVPDPDSIDNLKTIAVSRLMLDNFDHIKTY